MSLFKKKGIQLEKPTAPEENPRKTEIMEARDEATIKEQLTVDDKKLLDRIAIYKKNYDGVYNAQDFLAVNSVYIEAEKLNLNFAAYAELVGLREDIRELTKAVKGIQKTENP